MDAPPDQSRASTSPDRFLGATRVVGLGLGLTVFTLLLPSTPLEHSFEAILGSLAAMLAGGSLPFLFFHAFRATGLGPPAVLLAGLAVLLAWLQGGWPWWTPVTVGFATGVVYAAWLWYEFPYARLRHPAGTRRRLPRADWAIMIVILTGFAALQIWYSRLAVSEVQSGLLLFLLALLAFSSVRLFRPLFELCVEFAVWRNYRITAHGPGITTFPTTGPVLVIANHACWWDPLFLAKILPRPITPMMTSAFYDRWYLKPLMVYVFDTIRVADMQIRREAPEIQQAVQALNAGKCVVIFPEGFLRRKEGVPLRRFGRGVWEILKARPQTPVVAGWIEGGWGSYASYWNGPPTKNKPRSGRRSITIGLSEPHTLEAGALQHHLQTRLALMNVVSEARELLGLPRLPLFEWKSGDDAEPPVESPGPS